MRVDEIRSLIKVAIKRMLEADFATGRTASVGYIGNEYHRTSTSCDVPISSGPISGRSHL